MLLLLLLLRVCVFGYLIRNQRAGSSSSRRKYRSLSSPAPTKGRRRSRFCIFHATGHRGPPKNDGRTESRESRRGSPSFVFSLLIELATCCCWKEKREILWRK
uniref:Putative secreted peptide n=1 Tax=Anopheles braziliensis TaxID=58242 RepID=A0A2M3ZV08_9DIPT